MLWGQNEMPSFIFDKKRTSTAVTFLMSLIYFAGKYLRALAKIKCKFVKWSLDRWLAHCPPTPVRHVHPHMGRQARLLLNWVLSHVCYFLPLLAQWVASYLQGFSFEPGSVCAESAWWLWFPTRTLPATPRSHTRASSEMVTLSTCICT